MWSEAAGLQSLLVLESYSALNLQLLIGFAH